jgi:hypothetical protein
LDSRIRICRLTRLDSSITIQTNSRTRICKSGFMRICWISWICWICWICWIYKNHLNLLKIDRICDHYSNWVFKDFVINNSNWSSDLWSSFKTNPRICKTNLCFTNLIYDSHNIITNSSRGELFVLYCKFYNKVSECFSQKAILDD